MEELEEYKSILNIIENWDEQKIISKAIPIYSEKLNKSTKLINMMFDTFQTIFIIIIILIIIFFYLLFAHLFNDNVDIMLIYNIYILNILFLSMFSIFNLITTMEKLKLDNYTIFLIILYLRASGVINEKLLILYMNEKLIDNLENNYG